MADRGWTGIDPGSGGRDHKILSAAEQASLIQFTFVGIYNNPEGVA